MDFQHRAMTGPVMKADDFDLEFSMKVRELVADYNIEYNEEDSKHVVAEVEVSPSTAANELDSALVQAPLHGVRLTGADANQRAEPRK